MQKCFQGSKDECVVRSFPGVLDVTYVTENRITDMAAAQADPRGFHVATMGYTEEQLRKAFELVENPLGWKKPVYAIVRNVPSHAWMRVAHLISVAVDFFTATKASVRAVPERTNETAPTYGIIVIAEGYEAGPAGDH